MVDMYRSFVIDDVVAACLGFCLDQGRGVYRVSERGDGDVGAGLHGPGQTWATWSALGGRALRPRWRRFSMQELVIRTVCASKQGKTKNTWEKKKKGKKGWLLFRFFCTPSSHFPPPPTFSKLYILNILIVALWQEVKKKTKEKEKLKVSFVIQDDADRAWGRTSPKPLALVF